MNCKTGDLVAASAKYAQIKKEALATVAALGLLIMIWLAAGFGLADVDITVFHLPLWALLSTVGVWLTAIVLVKLLLTFVFKDMNLLDEEDYNE